MVIKRTNFAGEEVQMDLPVTKQQIEDWQNGEYIQLAFPQLNADQREFLISGMLPGEWNGLFGEE